MGAPKRNKFWLLRAKHGPDKLFKSPELLWEAACAYFEYCDTTPLPTVEYVGKDAKKVIVYKLRAFTWTGLELYLGISSLRWYKTSDKYKKFKGVIDQIEKVMYTQKFEGAAAGLLNHAIIARDLGLVDKQENDVTTKGESINKGFYDLLKEISVKK